ncbi:MAG: tocopherol cyclase family protein [Oscillospiraceae bacterium]|nr:tocopherol cyclase family protein [Oscillospiraceae bacterium]
MKNPELFQGKNRLRYYKNYFEGWYFKHSNNDLSISFIPGISIKNGNEQAFIQVITKDTSYCVFYDFDEFTFSASPFFIQIGKSLFSKDKIELDINDEKQNLSIYGTILYSNIQEIQKTRMSPNIMGPFSHVPFMECNHGILSMKHKIDGKITVNEDIYNFNNGHGYIEKDWGTSFPKTYLWCQANSFKESDCSLSFATANIPFGLFSFRGLICSCIVKGKEYRFATYNNSKLVKYEITDNTIGILLKKGTYSLSIKCDNVKGFKLLSPVKGDMKKPIFETINSVIDMTLKKQGKVIHSDTSINAGLEIVR